jgi:beta-glucuronidase
MENEGGNLPFEAEVTARVEPGRESVIAVRIDNTLTGETIPPALPWKQQGRPFEYYFDFLNMSGLNRPVRLYATPKTYLSDVTVRTDIKGSRGAVAVETKVEGRADGARLTLLDGEGKAAASAEGAQASASLTVTKCRFWSAADPYLYTLRVEVLKGGKTIDEYSLPVGVRTVEARDGKLLVNGEPVYMKGACRHEDFPVLGRGMNEAVLVKDMSLMKWMNANSYRTVHYPHSEEELELADRMGFLIIDETAAVGMNDWNHRVFTEDVVNDRTREAHKRLLERQYERDKNHPCVVIWSLANEPASNEEAFVGYIEPLFRRIRELDSTRPAAFVISSFPQEEKAAHLCDLLLVNRYHSWYQRTGQLDAIDTDFAKELDDWHAKYGKPIIVTEFGADTIPGFHHHPPLIFSEEYQLEFMKRHAAAMDARPFVIGEHVWVAFDFATKQDLRRVDGNRKGLFTRTRQPKMAAHYMRERWKGK